MILTIKYWIPDDQNEIIQTDLIELMNNRLTEFWSNFREKIFINFLYVCWVSTCSTVLVRLLVLLGAIPLFGPQLARAKTRAPLSAPSPPEPQQPTRYSTETPRQLQLIHFFMPLVNDNSFGKFLSWLLRKRSAVSPPYQPFS